MTTACPCHSGKTYQQCCEPYVTGQQPAPTPEALMRSRYTAYTQGNVDYLEHTTQGKAAQGFNREAVRIFATESDWGGLDIVRSYMVSDSKGMVEFVAHYNDKHGHHHHLHEMSDFQLIDGRWFYVDGQQQEDHGHHHHGHQHASQPVRHQTTKVGRNDPCSCGSGKKYKKCCG
jgi:SEC-C motif-containing protein